jgi:hypothetical protein
MIEQLFNTKTFILNKRNNLSIPISEFCDAVLTLETINNIAEFYEIGRIVVRNRLKEYLPCYPQLNCIGNRTLRLALLEQVGKACCTICNQIKELENFSKTNVNTKGIRYTCKECSKETRDVQYHREYCKAHYSKNKAYYYNKKQRRRVKVQSQTTLFGQEGLADFYNNRPKGVHIDHIVPINHPLVSGLHNIFNLQYLTPEENLRKSNYFEVT